MGDKEKFTFIDRAAKEKKTRTATRTRSLRDAKELQRSLSGGYGAHHLSPTAFYLTLLGGLVVCAAFTYWIVVISWTPSPK